MSQADLVIRGGKIVSPEQIVDGGPVDGLGRDRRGQKSGGGNEGEQTRHRTP